MKVKVSFEIEHTTLSELMKLLDKEDIKPVAKTRQRKKEGPTDMPESPVILKDEEKCEAVDPPTMEPTQTDIEITDGAIKAEAAKLIRANRQPEVKALLNKYGVERVSAVPQEKRAAFLKEIEEMLK